MVMSTNKMGRDSAAMRDRAVHVAMMYHLEPGQQWQPAHDPHHSRHRRLERARRLRSAHVEGRQGVIHAFEARMALHPWRTRALEETDGNAPCPWSVERSIFCCSKAVAKTAFPKRRVTGTSRGCCFWPAAAAEKVEGGHVTSFAACGRVSSRVLGQRRTRGVGNEASQSVLQRPIVDERVGAVPGLECAKRWAGLTIQGQV